MLNINPEGEEANDGQNDFDESDQYAHFTSDPKSDPLMLDYVDVNMEFDAEDNDIHCDDNDFHCDIVIKDESIGSPEGEEDGFDPTSFLSQEITEIQEIIQ